MSPLVESDADHHDWDARAKQALERARALPPGADRLTAVRKAEQLQLAANMRQWLSTRHDDREPDAGCGST